MRIVNGLAAFAVAATCSVTALAQAGNVIADTTGGVIEIAAEPVSRLLEKSSSTPITAELAVQQTHGPILLYVNGIRAPVPSVTSYNVFLGLPPGTPGASADDPHYAGTFGLYNVKAGSSEGTDIAFDVTSLIRWLRKYGDLPLNVTVRPMGGDSSPITIDAIALASGEGVP